MSRAPLRSRVPRLWARLRVRYTLHVLVYQADNPDLAAWAIEAFAAGIITRHELVRRLKQAHGISGKL